MVMDGSARMATVTTSSAPPPVHGLYLRIAHWINAVAIMIMIGSGWEIYNAAPLFGFVFPKSITLGGWLAGALLWHFAAMWVLVINGLGYVLIGLASGGFRERFFPIRLRDAVADIAAALQGKLRHDDSFSYNAAQRLLYVGVLIVGVVTVLSGVAIWKPVQLFWLTSTFGGYETARLIHFICMTSIVLFFLVHVVMAFLAPKRLRAMIQGS
jgi:thiosulfate reductase cytochrome b subunit